MATNQSLLLAFLGVVALVEGGFFPLPADNKIVNGHEIDISRVPWQVSLLLDDKHNCGGSIISPQWVLSAAHCTLNYKVSQLKIRIGSNSTSEGGKVYEVEQVVNHEAFTFEGCMSDISLLKTTRDMSLQQPLKAATLPSLGAKRPPVDTSLVVSGWGMMENYSYPTLLRAVDVNVRDFEECRGISHCPGDESTQICAGLPGKDSCSGDSGGPLVKGELLVGIVSYGSGKLFCGALPGVYTDVAAHRQWIKTHTGL